MDTNVNYYAILKVNNDSSVGDIKKSYYTLSKIYHPDLNKDIDPKFFNLISEAYSILSDVDKKYEYDLKSRFGKNYNEYFELFDIKIDYDYNIEKNNLEKFKKNEVLDIFINVDDTFSGFVEYERYVKCKLCDGTGKDLSAKIHIKDNDGNIIKTFDSDDGCDFCEGTGKSYDGNKCSFCSGAGKVGLTLCKKCNGEKRVLGKQKISGIVLTGCETKIDSMGHYSKDVPGKVGYVLLRKTK